MTSAATLSNISSKQTKANVMPYEKAPISKSTASSNVLACQEQFQMFGARVPIVPDGGGYYSDGMEVVWHGEFSRLFSFFHPPHVWYLTITNQAPQQKWKHHRDSAKVRFCCQDCGNGWTSMKGRVTFWFHLDLCNQAGFVQFKLYGQQCKKCNSGKFEYVMWYPEEVSKVMNNVFNKVGQTYYGFFQPPIRVDRRPGRPRNQHNSILCQACQDGECDQGRSKSSSAVAETSPSKRSPLANEVEEKDELSIKSPTNNGLKLNKQISSNYSLKSIDLKCRRSEQEITSADTETGLRKENAKNITMPLYPVVSSNSNSPMPFTAPFSTVNSYFYYHPVPRQLTPGCLPPSAIYPLFSTSLAKQRFPPSSNLSTITELLATTKISDETAKIKNKKPLESQKENEENKQKNSSFS